MAFPTSIPSNTDPTSGNTQNSPSHSQLHQSHNAEIVAIETKVGMGSSTPTSGKVLRATGTGTSGWGQTVLSTDIATATSADLRGILSDETGTGAAVFGTAPTISAPVVSTGTFASPVLTTPAVVTSINDANGNEVIKTPATASATNEITVTNAANSSSPLISATGSSDSNINLLANGKGTGMFVPRMATPQGYLVNGQITTAVASNNLTVAIKTIQGNDPSAADPVYIRIGNTVRTLTAALSVTKNAGTSWFGKGASYFATVETDYFVYLVWNTTDTAVTIAFSSIPDGRTYADFSTTTTNWNYWAGSGSAPASTNEVENIGRFNATLSATASFNWSIPATSIIVNRPIFETRIFSFTNSGTTAGTLYIKQVGSEKKLEGISANQTSNNSSPSYTITLPVGFFTTIRTIVVAAVNMTVDGRQYISINSFTTTSLTVTFNAPNGAATTATSIIITGT